MINDQATVGMNAEGDTAEYLRHTEYAKEIGGLRRLHFIVNAVRRHAEARSNRVVVYDFGCGTGNISLPLASLGIEVIGYDIDRKSIDLAAGKSSFRNVTFVSTELNSHKYAGYFDVIVCSEVLEHMHHPEQTLDSLRQMLKDDGMFIISVPNGYSLLELFWGFWRYLKTTALGGGLVRTKDLLKGGMKLPGSIQTADRSHYHLQHFSMSKFRKLMHACDMSITVIDNASSVVMDLYCLALRHFVKPGTQLFQHIDRLDSFAAGFSPPVLATGWMFVVSKPFRRAQKS
jgi:2-polyprenyl-3-methyl-5-hydroxy-6-metoxy-1,4-benzoquinol methylase